LEQSILLSDLLLKENISVPDYLKTTEGDLFVKANDTFYVLMKKISGQYCVCQSKSAANRLPKVQHLTNAKKGNLRKQDRVKAIEEEQA
jgi:hypothetical protein